MTRKTLLALVVSVSVLIATPLQAVPITFNSYTQFSGTQGQNDWYYGYYDGGGTFTFSNPPVLWVNDAGYQPGGGYYRGDNGIAEGVLITALPMHPSYSTATPEVASVRRWINSAGVASSLSIDGTVQRTDPRIEDPNRPGTGLDPDGKTVTGSAFSVRLNGVAQTFVIREAGTADPWVTVTEWQMAVGNLTKYEYEVLPLGLTVNPNDKIDFVLGSMGNASYDTTDVFAQVVSDPVPEPATMGLLAFGALALLQRRRRK